MALQVSETMALRLSSLLFMLGAASGSISSLVLATYPADHYPVAKLVCLLLAVAGLLCSAAQAQSKPLVKTASNINTDTPIN